jgi:hypothetical protein
MKRVLYRGTDVHFCMCQKILSTILPKVLCDTAQNLAAPANRHPGFVQPWCIFLSSGMFHVDGGNKLVENAGTCLHGVMIWNMTIKICVKRKIRFILCRKYNMLLVTKTSHVIPFQEMTPAYSENRRNPIDMPCGENKQFLGAFARLQKATISFVISVCRSAWNNSALTRRIFMKFDIWVFFENRSRNFKFH